MENPKHEFTNQLINETSPYLLQHAHNPVEWHAWNEETLEKAKRENKMILVSIGYSACHWCHVMEHESFEDTAVANIMNAHFICIKVDREERPDVDQVYMDAVQAISGRGGWPLNCFALPDGRPFWGGTYFPKQQWIEILTNINDLFNTQHQKLKEQAASITEGLAGNQFLNTEIAGNNSFDRETANTMIQMMQSRFDQKNGGSIGAPKFPMPNNSLFLLEYEHRTKNAEILNHLNRSLKKMAEGGIYDQAGGGFARYSVDDYWHVPHFEKMLYDNAQLVSLYSKAFEQTKNPEYKRIVDETLAFVKRELTAPDGGYYASLDADSDGEEGKFYVWTSNEIRKVAGNNEKLVFDYFGIDKEALWEDGKNILVKNDDIPSLAHRFNITSEEVREIIGDVKIKLMAKRAKRVRPALDDKILTSWNGLMVNGTVDAYLATGESQFLETTLRNGNFLLKNLKQADGGLFHSFKHGVAKIPGFLEDYTFVIEAFINLYEATCDESWLNEAQSLTDYAFEHFYDDESGMFYFTADNNSNLVARKMEITDNVIPASNSSLANSLVKLSNYFENTRYRETAEKMLRNVADNLQKYPTAFSNWGIVNLKFAYPYATFVITGPEAAEKARELHGNYLPEVLVAVAKSRSGLPIFESRFKSNETLIYVCFGSECKLPVKTIEEALKLVSEEY